MLGAQVCQIYLFFISSSSWTFC